MDLQYSGAPSDICILGVSYKEKVAHLNEGKENQHVLGQNQRSTLATSRVITVQMSFRQPGILIQPTFPPPALSI